MSSYNGIEIDLSELEGRGFECSPRCGLCCLCQPELLPEERAWFRKNHPKAVELKRAPHRHHALALKKGRGSCVFLQDRRCSVYSHRPHFCRQFPYHFHVGERVQVELDLSCRGVWGDAPPASIEAEELIAANIDVLRRTLSESRGVYEEFYSNCRRVLSPGGIFALQTASPILQRDLFEVIISTLKEIFPAVTPCFGPAPIYASGLWSWTLASAGHRTDEPDRDRLEELAATTRYYNEEIHLGAFAVPNELRRIVAG